MYQAIQSERLYQKIVDQIELRILSGALKIGDQLPSERELGEQFAVSRTAVREAVKALREKGLVEVSPGRGTFITNSTSRVARNSLGLMVKIGQVERSSDLVEVREMFEPGMTALAALRATTEEIAAMQSAIDRMDACLNDASGYIEADFEFHRTLAEASHNSLMPLLIDFIVDVLREQRLHIFQVPGGPQRGQNHHKTILAAVIRHDPEAAQEAMKLHLRQVRQDNESWAQTHSSASLGEH